MKSLIIIAMIQVFAVASLAQSSSLLLPNYQAPEGSVSDSDKSDDDTTCDDDDESYASNQVYENKVATRDYETQRAEKYHDHMLKFIDRIPH